MSLARELSVSFKSAVLPVNWVTFSAGNFLPFAQSTTPLPCAGEGLIESSCWCNAKCAVRAVFSLSWIDDGSTVLNVVDC